MRSVTDTVCTPDALGHYSYGYQLWVSEDGESYAVSGIGSLTNAHVVIPSSYKGKPVTAIGDGAFENCQTIASVIVPEGVTSIGNRAFFDCIGLSSVILPEGVAHIGESAFAFCKTLVRRTPGDSSMRSKHPFTML